jgi:hypothetical protein
MSLNHCNYTVIGKFLCSTHSLAVQVSASGVLAISSSLEYRVMRQGSIRVH